MAEAKVLHLLKSTNKPYNVQGVADMLASQGIKKGQAEKTLIALAQSGKIICKEFGKTKVFYLSQEGLAQLDPEVHITSIYSGFHFSTIIASPTYFWSFPADLMSIYSLYLPLQEKAAKLAQIKELSDKVRAQDEAIAALKKGMYCCCP